MEFRSSAEKECRICKPLAYQLNAQIVHSHYSGSCFFSNGIKTTMCSGKTFSWYQPPLITWNFLQKHIIKLFEVYFSNSLICIKESIKFPARSNIICTGKHSQPNLTGLENFSIFLDLRSHRHYDAPYGPSSTPRQLCCLSEKFQMSHEVLYFGRGRKNFYESVKNKSRVISSVVREKMKFSKVLKMCLYQIFRLKSHTIIFIFKAAYLIFILLIRFLRTDFD